MCSFDQWTRLGVRLKVVHRLFSRQFRCLFQFDEQKNQGKGRIAVGHDVGPLIIGLEFKSICVGKGWLLRSQPG